MKKTSLCALCVGLLLGSSTGLQAEIIAYDGFDYVPVGDDVLGNEGGFGFNGPWKAGGFNASFHQNYDIGNGSLTFGNLNISGNSLTTGPTPAIAGLTRDLQIPLGAAGTTRYISFLVRPEGTIGRGIFGGFFGLVLEQPVFTELFAGKPGVSNLNYVLERRGGAFQVPTTLTAEVGVTVLLVVKCEFVNGNDTFTLYLNPTPGMPEPLIADAVQTSFDLTSVQGLTVYSSGAFSLDEIRLGETFEDVTPATIPVTVDVKPGSDTNPVNMKANSKSKGKSISAGGVLPVAILSDDNFDATSVDDETVLLGDPVLSGAVPPIRATVEDLDDDGDDDLLLHFSIEEMVDFLAIDEESVLLELTGETFGGVDILGLDVITIKP